MTFEVTYNVTFRGASTIVPTDQDKSDFINPETEVAPYVMPKRTLDIGDLKTVVLPGTSA